MSRPLLGARTSDFEARLRQIDADACHDGCGLSDVGCVPSTGLACVAGSCAFML